jgi:hypothetical protein
MYLSTGVRWGPDVVVYHPADGRLGDAAGGLFDPWATAPRQAAPKRAASAARAERAPASAAPAPSARARHEAEQQRRQAAAGSAGERRDAEGERRRAARAPQTEHSSRAASRLPDVLDRAAKAGLIGPLGAAGGHADGESGLAAELRRGVRERARQTYDVGRLGDAVKWFGEFAEDTARAPMFLPLVGGTGDVAAKVYNQESLDMFAEYVRRRGSRLKGRAGQTLQSDTVATYVGAIKKLRSHEAHYAVVDASVNMLAPSAFKRMRQIDGPPGQRKLALGLRARHLRAIAQAGFNRSSKRGAVEWAAAVLAHNILLRGGELGVVDGKEFDTARDLTLGAVEFREPCAESKGLPWLTVDVVPIKDTTARRREAVMPVRRRAAGGELGGDPLDAYDAVVLAVAARLGRMPPTRGRVQGAEALKPLFVTAKGAKWATADTRRLAQRLAGLIGLDGALYGAKSFRIGGATDYRAVYGPAGAERLIRQRGRWWSDIHAIYERALAEEHLGGSAAVGGADGAELEVLCKGWAQPATFR